MGRSVPHNLKSTHQTEFVKIFNSLCGRYGRWEIWQDFVTLAAIAISNTVDRSQAAEREKTYMTIAGKYKPEEMLKFSQMLQEVVIGMDFNPDQDFLGELYMALDLGNDHAGQFFTPYDVCRMMAEITGTDLQARIERDGWISVNDCACGAGALLVPYAMLFRGEDGQYAPEWRRFQREWCRPIITGQKFNEYWRKQNG